MVKPTKSIVGHLPRGRGMTRRLLSMGSAVALSITLSCSASKEIAEIQYSCESSPQLASSPANDGVCGADDPDLAGMKPELPTEVCETLKANRFADDLSLPSEENQDTARIQAALTNCKTKGKVVKLVADGSNNAFIASQLTIDSADRKSVV